MRYRTLGPPARGESLYGLLCPERDDRPVLKSDNKERRTKQLYSEITVFEYHTGHTSRHVSFSLILFWGNIWLER